MKVLINALGAEMGGALRHLTNLIPALAVAAEDRAQVCIVHSAGTALPRVASPRVSFRSVPVKGVLSRLAYDSVVLPLASLWGGFDCLVSVTNFGPIYCPIPHVIFQRNALYFCDTPNQDHRKSLDLVLRQRLVQVIMSNSDCIVVPSAAMGDLVVRHSPRVSGKVRVLHHAYERPAALTPRVTHEGAYKIIYPVHPGAHKRFDEVAEVLAELASRAFDFEFYAPMSRHEWPGVLVYEELVDRLGLTERVHFVGRLNHEGMTALYRSADAMIYASMCESFGFPLLEGMGEGVPVVAVDTPVNRELCGECALFYQPGNVVEAADKVILACLPQTAGELRMCAWQRLESFPGSWTDYAERLLEILEDVA